MFKFIIKSAIALVVLYFAFNLIYKHSETVYANTNARITQVVCATMAVEDHSEGRSPTDNCMIKYLKFNYQQRTKSLNFILSLIRNSAEREYKENRWNTRTQAGLEECGEDLVCGIAVVQRDIYKLNVAASNPKKLLTLPENQI